MHQKSDRDHYIELQKRNIDQKLKQEFDIAWTDESLEYDFLSIMHPGWTVSMTGHSNKTNSGVISYCNQDFLSVLLIK